MSDLKVAAIQYDIKWEKPEHNFKHLETLTSAVSADVFILPETFSTGFSFSEDSVENYESSISLAWLKKISEKRGAAFCGSVITEEEGKKTNRFYWVDTDQRVFYDKRHLFSYGSENEHLEAGNAREIITYKTWKILPQICYDLRFPVFSRNKLDGANYNYDLAIYIANWPAVRISAWSTLLMARAIENQCYVIGVNRTGEDGNGLKYNGHSAIVNPNGEEISSAKKNSEAVLEEHLSLNKLNKFRERFPVLKDQDHFKIEF